MCRCCWQTRRAGALRFLMSEGVRNRGMGQSRRVTGTNRSFAAGWQGVVLDPASVL